MRRFYPATGLALSVVLTLPIAAQQKHRTPPQTDWQLEAKVQAVLASEPAFKGSSIFTSVNQGVVKLTGNVRSDAEKTIAASELANIKGIKSVENDLAVVTVGHGSGGIGSGADRGYGPPAATAAPTTKVLSLCQQALLSRSASPRKSTPKQPRQTTLSTERPQAPSAQAAIRSFQPEQP